MDTLLGSCSFRGCFQPPRVHGWRGSKPGDQTPGLAMHSEQPGSDPLPTPAQVGARAACPIGREEVGVGRPAGGGRWGGSLCRVCAPLEPDNRGEPQLPLRGSALLHLQLPSPENPQRHARWRLGQGNLASPCTGSLALLAVARLGGHVNSRPMLGGGSMAQGLHEAQAFGRT